MQLTGGRGPDSCMDAVGLEAHMPGPLYYYDRIKQAVMSESDRPIALRQAIMACRNGGTVSVPGVYSGLIDKMPMGAVVNKALTIKTGQTHVQRYFKPLLDRITHGDIDPSFVVTHRLKLDDAPIGFDIFNRKQDGCIKIVMAP
jgi:threonine dehydrogenase-like Zn-dependent dehydrogenase